jgi:hypothetical protein
MLMRSRGAWIAGGLLALLGLAAAPLGGGPVTHLLAWGAAEELRTVAGDQIRQRQPLGLNTVFGVSGDRLATISQRDVGGHVVAHLMLFDAKTGSLLAERDIDAPVMTAMSPQRLVVLRPHEDALYFVTQDVSARSISDHLTRFELKTGKMSRFEIPADLTNPWPFEFGDLVGVYSPGRGEIAILKDDTLKEVVPPRVRPPAMDTGPPTVAIGLPGVGIARVTLSGKVEIFDPAKAGAPPIRTLELGTPVAEPQAAMLDGKPVLVYAEARQGARSKNALTALVIYDPVAGKAVWRKQLPWLARTFTVSSDATLFRLIPLMGLNLTYYDRKSDAFTKSVALKPRELERLIIIPSD